MLQFLMCISCYLTYSLRYPAGVTTKPLTRHVFSLCTICMLLSIIAVIVEASDGFTVSHAQSQVITAFSTCRNVTNNSPTGSAVYVPTQTSAEWASFYDNLPSGVTAGSCAGILIKSAALPSPRTMLSCAYSTANNKIYCFGGWSGTAMINQVIEYDPPTDIVTIKSAIVPTLNGVNGRSGLSCANNPGNNRIYCAGGDTANGLVSQIFEYNPLTDTLAVRTSLSSGRSGLSCTTNTSANKINCFGGYTSMANINQNAEYTPSSNSLVIRAVLPSIRDESSCAFSAVTGKTYCFGGDVTGSNAVNEISEYDPVANTMVVKSTTLPAARKQHSCVTHTNGLIYCFGGASSFSIAARQIYEYNPATNTIVTLAHQLPAARTFLSCVSYPPTNKIYCLGGSSPGAVSQIVEYTP